MTTSHRFSLFHSRGAIGHGSQGDALLLHRTIDLRQHFSFHPTSPASTPQDEEGPGNPHTHTPLLAPPILFHRASLLLNLSTNMPSSPPQSPYPTTGPGLPPQSGPASPCGLVFGWGLEIETELLYPSQGCTHPQSMLLP